MTDHKSNYFLINKIGADRRICYSMTRRNPRIKNEVESSNSICYQTKVATEPLAKEAVNDFS
jgi:hypothetical protein